MSTCQRAYLRSGCESWLSTGLVLSSASHGLKIGQVFPYNPERAFHKSDRSCQNVLRFCALAQCARAPMLPCWWQGQLIKDVKRVNSIQIILLRQKDGANAFRIFAGHWSAHWSQMVRSWRLTMQLLQQQGIQVIDDILFCLSALHLRKVSR